MIDAVVNVINAPCILYPDWWCRKCHNAGGQGYPDPYLF